MRLTTAAAVPGHQGLNVLGRLRRGNHLWWGGTVPSSHEPVRSSRNATRARKRSAQGRRNAISTQKWFDSLGASVQSYIKRGYHSCVDMDLSKFFDRVQPDVLMSRVARKVHLVVRTGPGVRYGETGGERFENNSRPTQVSVGYQFQCRRRSSRPP